MASSFDSKNVDYDAFYRDVYGDKLKQPSQTASGLAVRQVQTVAIDPRTGKIVQLPTQATPSNAVQVSPTSAQTRAEQAASRSVINNIPTQGVQGARTVAMPAGVRPNVTIPPLPSGTGRDERLPQVNVVPGTPIGPISPDSSMVIRNYSPTTGFSDPLLPTPAKVAPIPMTFPGIMPANLEVAQALAAQQAQAPLAITVGGGTPRQSVAQALLPPKTPEQLAVANIPGANQKLRQNQINTYNKRQNQIKSTGSFTGKGGTYTPGQKVVNSRGQTLTVQSDGSFR
jgi:hypothetical protein